MEKHEKIMREKGYSSKEEFFALAAQIPFTRVIHRVNYLRWEALDGSKQGLEELIRNSVSEREKKSC